MGIIADHHDLRADKCQTEIAGFLPHSHHRDTGFSRYPNLTARLLPGAEVTSCGTAEILDP